MVTGCAGAVGIPAPIIEEMKVKLGENEKGEVWLTIYFPQYIKLRGKVQSKIHLINLRWDASAGMGRGVVQSVYIDMRRYFIEAMYQHWRCPVPKNLTPEAHIYTDLTDYELELIDNCSTSYTGLIFHD